MRPPERSGFSRTTKGSSPTEVRAPVPLRGTAVILGHICADLAWDGLGLNEARSVKR